jgi:2-oxoglutarate ferredoxin oxidoreductase subunit alpha
MADFVYLGFDLADQYRNPVVILSDGAIGQMMEKVTFRPYQKPAFDKSWATTGKIASRKRNSITSLFIQPERMEQQNLKLEEKFNLIRKNEVRYEEFNTQDADYLFVAYGLSARIAQKAMDLAREKGLRVGLLRPITLFPFPEKRIRELATQVQGILTVELNSGQMIEDVKLAVEGRVAVKHYGRMGGMIFTPEEIEKELETIISPAYAS